MHHLALSDHHAPNNSRHPHGRARNNAASEHLHLCNERVIELLKLHDECVTRINHSLWRCNLASCLHLQINHAKITYLDLDRLLQGMRLLVPSETNARVQDKLVTHDVTQGVVLACNRRRTLVSLAAVLFVFDFSIVAVTHLKIYLSKIAP